MGWDGILWSRMGPEISRESSIFKHGHPKKARELLQSSFQEMNLQKFRTGLCSLGFRLLAALLLHNEKPPDHHGRLSDLTLSALGG